MNDPFFQDAFGSDLEEPEAEPQPKLDKKAEKKQLKKDLQKSKQQLQELFPNEDEDNNHFNAKDILKKEKLIKSKSKKMKAKLKNQQFETQDSYQLDVTNDSRFKALLQDHEFSIDPNNSQ